MVQVHVLVAGKTNTNVSVCCFRSLKPELLPSVGVSGFWKKTHFRQKFGDFLPITMQGVKNFIQSKALGVAEYITPVLKVIGSYILSKTQDQ